MTRKMIGITALIGSVMCYIGNVFSVMTMNENVILFSLLSWICGLVAFFCLIGFVIRYVGKKFAEGWSEGLPQYNPGYCSNCGNKVLDNAKFCNYCGKKVGTESYTREIKSK